MRPSAPPTLTPTETLTRMSTSGAGPSFDLTNRVALVTGGGRGIGRGIALALAHAGADVVLAARSRDQLDATAEEIEGLGRRALAIPTNVADLDELAALFDKTDQEFGRLDILANNAGIGLRTPVLEVTPEEWDRVLNINLRSVFFASQYGLRLMVRGGYGRIINTASLTSFLGFKPISVYGASKGGVGAADQSPRRGVRRAEHHRQRHRARLHTHRPHAAAVRRPCLEFLDSGANSNEPLGPAGGPGRSGPSSSRPSRRRS